MIWFFAIEEALPGRPDCSKLEQLGRAPKETMEMMARVLKKGELITFKSLRKFSMELALGFRV